MKSHTASERGKHSDKRSSLTSVIGDAVLTDMRKKDSFIFDLLTATGRRFFSRTFDSGRSSALNVKKRVDEKKRELRKLAASLGVAGKEN